MELSAIKGLGEKNQKLLQQCNIFSVEDLLSYYPYRYEFLNPSSNLLNDEQMIQVVNVCVFSEAKVSYIRRNFNTLRFQAKAQDKMIQVSIFNRAFLKPNLTLGREITIIGKYNEKKNQFVANDIKLNVVKEAKITPVYHLVKGLKNVNLEQYMLDALRKPITLLDKIPVSYLEQYHLFLKRKHYNIYINLEMQKKLKKLVYVLFMKSYLILCLRYYILRKMSQKHLGCKELLMFQK